MKFNLTRAEPFGENAPLIFVNLNNCKSTEEVEAAAEEIRQLFLEEFHKLNPVKAS